MEPRLASSPGKLPEQIVDTMRAVFGPHPGFPPVHAKGLFCSGTFQASPSARTVCRAVHFQGAPIAVTVRFSNVSSNPNIHDGLTSTRGMSVKFQLPDGSAADILANSVEGFSVRTPEEFLGFFQAQLPDPVTGQPVPERLQAFAEAHPGTKAFLERLAKKPVPASFAQASYHAGNAFRFLAQDGSSRFGRYRWIPEAGEFFLSPEQAGKRDPNFLRTELTERLARGPVYLRLELQLAAEGDPTDDPTQLWPADRPLVEMGRLEITDISPTSDTDLRGQLFDATHLTDGIELSADPILLSKRAAYLNSLNRRNQESRNEEQE